jgi:sugar diacid utilization regulator
MSETAADARRTRARQDGPAADDAANEADSNGRPRRRGYDEVLRASLDLLQRENATLLLLVAIHDRLGALVLEGADAARITRALSELISRQVLLLDPLLRPVPLDLPAGEADEAPDRAESFSWEPNEAYVGRVLQTMAGERRSMRLPPLPAWGVDRGCVLAPVVAGDATLGYLAILEPETPGEESDAQAEAELLAAQHAASVYALALMRERLTEEVTSELRDELLEGLLSGQVTDEQALRERARRLGYDESLSYHAMVLLPAGAGPAGDQAYRPVDLEWAAGWRRRLLESVAQLVRDRAPRSVVSRRRDELAVLLPEAGGPGPTELGRSISLYVASLYPEWPLTVGVGAPARSPREIARSYAQARRAAEVALRFGRRGEVINFESLGLYRLLFQITDRAELRAFVEQVLGPLLEYDRKHRTDFVRTVETYLANKNSLQATARALYIHVNTAAYRIQRIQEITGLDLGKTEDCLLARASLMILEDIDVGT